MKSKPKSRAKKNAKPKVKKNSVLQAADQLRKTTKKMVDDVFLRFVGLRVLERAQQMSAALREEKAQAKKQEKPAKSSKISKKKTKGRQKRKG